MRTILQILNGTAIFLGILTARHMQQTETVRFSQLGKAFDKLLLQAIKLVCILRKFSGSDLIFKPNPLEERRFIQRRRSICVIFQQLSGIHTVIGQIQT